MEVLNARSLCSNSKEWIHCWNCEARWKETGVIAGWGRQNVSNFLYHCSHSRMSKEWTGVGQCRSDMWAQEKSNKVILWQAGWRVQQGADLRVCPPFMWIRFSNPPLSLNQVERALNFHTQLWRACRDLVFIIPQKLVDSPQTTRAQACWGSTSFIEGYQSLLWAEKILPRFKLRFSLWWIYTRYCQRSLIFIEFNNVLDLYF